MFKSINIHNCYQYWLKFKKASCLVTAHFLVTFFIACQLVWESTCDGISAKLLMLRRSLIDCDYFVLSLSSILNSLWPNLITGRCEVLLNHSRQAVNDYFFSPHIEISYVFNYCFFSLLYSICSLWSLRELSHHIEHFLMFPLSSE